MVFASHPWHPRAAWSKGIPSLKTCFILNPRSGAAARALPAVRAFAARRGAELHLTDRPRHATELAARAVAGGRELVVAVGGDGTVNEVARTLTGTGAILGLVPCGSGDGLGRDLGIHGGITRALSILEQGTPRPIDSGLADGHPFFVVAGLGFEAELADRFNRLRRRGFARYLWLAARTFAGWRPADYLVHSGTVSTAVRAFTLAVANASQYGNNARIAPAARLDDGCLDLCAVPPLSLWNAPTLAARLFAGNLPGTRGLLTCRAAAFAVERSGPGLLHTDGETHLAGPRVEFQICPASLRVLVPADSVARPHR